MNPHDARAREAIQRQAEIDAAVAPPLTREQFDALSVLLRPSVEAVLAAKARKQAA